MSTEMYFRSAHLGLPGRSPWQHFTLSKWCLLLLDSTSHPRSLWRNVPALSCTPPPGEAATRAVQNYIEAEVNKRETLPVTGSSDKICCATLWPQCLNSTLQVLFMGAASECLLTGNSTQQSKLPVGKRNSCTF